MPANTARTNHRKQGLANDLLARRYLWKDENGRVIETPRQLFQRVAEAVAAVEVRHESSLADAASKAFFRMMARREFLPNSPTLMNAGRRNGMTLSACFVLPIADSINSIFDAVKQTAQVQKAGGGTGFAFDRLRPTGDIVASSGGRTSGPISFMSVLAEATRAIQQGAFRRGANMGMLSVDHPDILRFIRAKGSPGVLENFNLSVKVTDAFMEALSDRPDEPHMVVSPRTGQRHVIPCDIDLGSYTIQDLVPIGHVSMPCFTIRDVWEMIVQQAHATGEPGVCFIDRVNAANPTPHVGHIEATNPCGEQPLLPYECCNLGSINLVKFVDMEQRRIAWDRLEVTIDHAVRFLDDVIDVNSYPIRQIEEATLGNRKTGLGIMGFADALILLGIRYDSDQAAQLAEEVCRFLSDKAHETSEKLARARGSFPNWERSVWDTEHHRPMRNAACTTIAPTGSISILAGCSSGIEPVFSLVTKRRALDGEEFVEIHPLVERLGQREGWMDKRVRAELLGGAPPRDVRGFPRRLAEVIVSAHEVAPEWHVRIQAAFQQHIDSAVSKTANLRPDATLEDVDKVFRDAYRCNCKGITVYRDTSREGQTLSAPGKAGLLEISAAATPRERTRVTRGQTSKARTGCGTLFVTVNRDEQGLCEVFASLGKAGGCPSQTEATCRAVSVALRSGVAPAVLIEQLKSIRCLSTSVARKGSKKVDVLSCPDAIARAIEEALGGLAEDAAVPAPASAVRKCPHCNQPMRRDSGCSICDRCLYDSCG